MKMLVTRGKYEGRVGTVVRTYAKETIYVLRFPDGYTTRFMYYEVQKHEVKAG